MPKTTAQIKLLTAGITQRQISVKTGFSANAVSQTLTGLCRNQIIQEAVAEILNVPAAELWGENYAPLWRQNKKQQKVSSVGGTD